MPTVDELLADTTPWSLADICRELDASPAFAAQWAMRSLMGEPESDRVLPPLEVGTPVPSRHLLRLLRAAQGRGEGPQWPAGVIRGWARRCARMDRDLNLIVRPPATAPASRRAALSQPKTPRYGGPGRSGTGTADGALGGC